MAAGETPGRLLGIVEATEPAARSFAAPDGKRESAVAAKLSRRCLGLGFNSPGGGKKQCQKAG